MTLKLYVIECSNNKYYIGKSNNINNRILEHFSNNGSQWTKKYKPINVIDIVENVDNFDEDKFTKIYMAKYGIDNVRGGSYCQIHLNTETKKFLEIEINGALDKCYYCGGSGHFINNCNRYNNNKYLQETKLNTIPYEKYIYIISKLDGKVLDIKNKNYSAKASVICFEKNEGNNQIWKIKKDGYIQSYLNELVLDINSDGDIFTNLKNDSVSQKWKFNNNLIINESNGLILTNTNELSLCGINNSNNQKWIFEEININIFQLVEKGFGLFTSIFS